jgi:hypothetical protein
MMLARVKAASGKQVLLSAGSVLTGGGGEWLHVDVGVWGMLGGGDVGRGGDVAR